ncbi:Flagellar hook protein FlgE [Legionella massiliensis]|uniref:Flagellar hook protein FlgE n=1 Tax=Legionella massiliensis TaxID=1034943 RepID=A0A078KZ65_9GAMM|nr:flagellar hook-basal body complex protein [Legionella massiliensis]CDZ77054.1 Flagellar hook protein FlgE [Legionella massiliensis]CEE12792.1 Flagellar hook protein FlgE [Legionella massiliensis]
MSNTYYTSLSGMLAASFGLQNTSHNVANMQSHGYKRNDVFYSSLGDERNQAKLGSGVRISGTGTNFSAGSYLESKNPYDLAIVGQGFFIIKQKNGELLYTRDGEFDFNNEGFLADRNSHGLVQGYDGKGNLVPIQKFATQTHIGKASCNLDLSGEFVLVKSDATNPDPTKGEYQSIKITLDAIYDSQGKKHSLELEFKTNKPFEGLEWNLERASYDGIEFSFNSQSIKFTSLASRSPEDPAQIQLKLPNEQSINLNFGHYWSDSGKSVGLKAADSTTSTSNIQIYKQDGYEEGRLVNLSFDDNGQLSHHYDNEQSLPGPYLAIAKFDDPEHCLIQTGDNLFRANNEAGRQIGRANQGGFGTIQPQKLESSNVDSTTEFANIVVLQRMFQACSQIMDIEKQLLEELYKK